MHVIRFDETSEGAPTAHETPDHMKQYQTAARKVALRHGVRISGWFAVKDTIIGDGRAWHHVRFNEFPSKAAFIAVATDPALADTYAVIVRADINDLAASVEP